MADEDWAPFTSIEIGWARKHGLSPATARRWALEGLRVCETVRAVALGVAPEEARRWTSAHFAPGDAVEAAETGVSLTTAIAWREAGFILPDAALLIRDGWTLAQAVAARYADVPGAVVPRTTTYPERIVAPGALATDSAAGAGHPVEFRMGAVRRVGEPAAERR